MGNSRTLGRRIAGPALLAFALAACGDAQEAANAEKPIAPVREEMKKETRQDLPPGAVKVGEDLYMVPAGRDRKGCQQYTAFSPNRAVAMVIYYRTPEGEFTVDRSRADCEE